MQNFLYVFTPGLAKQLEEEGLKLQKHEPKGKEYWLFLVDTENQPKFLFNFETGTDFIFSKRLFF